MLIPGGSGGFVAYEGTGAVLFNKPEPSTLEPGPAGGEDVIGPTGDLIAAVTPTPRGVDPSPEVLAAIEATALRYAGHPALRGAGLSATDWMMLFRANIEIESNYRQGAVSPVGAIGLGQLMPGTAAVLGVDPHDWDQNLDGSARYLLTQINRFGSADLALAAYNAGPEAVMEYGGIPPYDETQGHVRKVLAVFQRLTGESGP